MIKKIDCPFCQIAAGGEPADVIYEDKETIAFTPLEPAVAGHMLVIPKAHYDDYLDAPPHVLSTVMRVAQRMSDAVSVALSPEGLNLITSLGEAATQSVFHLHVHVLPRWKTDRIPDFWPPTTTALERSQDEIASSIRRALNEASDVVTGQ